MKRSHLLTAAAGALATLAAPAHALTVGEARVLSFTDQPLNVPARPGTDSNRSLNPDQS